MFDGHEDRRDTRRSLLLLVLLLAVPILGAGGVLVLAMISLTMA